jgi:hypothetical protein
MNVMNDRMTKLQKDKLESEKAALVKTQDLEQKLEHVECKYKNDVSNLNDLVARETKKGADLAKENEFLKKQVQDCEKLNMMGREEHNKCQHKHAE